MSAKIDKHSAAWAAVKSHVNERLVFQRARLEADIDEKETQQARAAIRELNMILGLVDVEPLLTKENDDLPY